MRGHNSLHGVDEINVRLSTFTDSRKEEYDVLSINAKDKDGEWNNYSFFFPGDAKINIDIPKTPTSEWSAVL